MANSKKSVQTDSNSLFINVFNMIYHVFHDLAMEFIPEQMWWQLGLSMMASQAASAPGQAYCLSANAAAESRFPDFIYWAI
ncbi:MAG: hypothetical protein GY943_09030 [Chloroflexi bacterium]|nr:hypothetical protein [Chloroflexota bacterium]